MSNQATKKRLGMTAIAAHKVELMRLAARPDGVRCTDIPHATLARVFNAAEQLVEEGRLFKVKFSHRVVRYYTDKRKADILKQVPPNMQVVLKPRQSAGWSKDEPVVVPPDVKITICPAPHVNTWHKKQVSRW